MCKIFSFLAICVSINVSIIQTTLQMSINVIDGHTIDIDWDRSLNLYLTNCKLTVFPLSSEDNTKLKTISLSGNHTLPVRVNGLTPGAKYNVNLEVSVNQTVSHEFERTVITKPNPPKNTIFCYHSVQSINVIWEVPETPSLFNEYQVCIHPKDSPISQKSVPKSKTTTVFDGLTPGRAYNISVQTKSGYQLSEPLIKKCRTMPAPPARVWYDPNTLTAHSFDIQWAAPDMLSEFDSFLIVKDEKLHTKISEKEFRFVKFTEDIKPGKTYKIEVTARSGVISSKPVGCNVTTRPLPLSTLKAYPGNNSDIVLEWTVSRDSTQDSFIVTFWEINEYVMKQSVRVMNSTFIHLNNLLSGRNYSIAVAAVSNNISSVPTVVYQPTRPTPPHIDKIVQTSDTVLNISWKVLNEIKINQTFYKVLFTRLDTSESKTFIINDYWALLYVFPGARYEINVTRMNRGLKSVASSIIYATPPKAPDNLRIKNYSTSLVCLEWDRPNDTLVDYYAVRYRGSTEKEWQEFLQTNKTLIEIKGLKIDVKYVFRVNSYSNGIESSNILEIEFEIGPDMTGTSSSFPEDPEQSKSQNKMIVLILLIIIIMILSIFGPGLYMYYKHLNQIKTQSEKLDDIEENEPLKTVNTENDIELDESLIIDRKELKIMEKIGQGQFGTVHFAILTVRSGRVPIDVAIKMSNVIENEKDMDEFLKEALIMKNFNHPNVLSLYGISFEPHGSPLVVLPFMKNRDVLKYIRNEENQPTVKQLMGFAIDVAKGMEYLSKQHFIHRDLAARNCMLDNDLNVKVADFGLSKATKDYYKNENSMKLMPIKWMSIESLEKGIYDTKTDVWSYGVLVWELMTRGIIPYPNLHHFEVLPFLRNGYRLPKPNYCPDLVYEILLECWSTKPQLRPTFEAIVIKLEEVFDTLIKVSTTQAVEIENVTYYNHPVSYSTTIL